MSNHQGYAKIIRHSSEKILNLINILKQYDPNVYEKSTASLEVNHARKPLSCIIFTQERFTAKIIYNILKAAKETNPEEFAFLQHDFIVGFNINPYNNTREQHYTKKQSHMALERFRNGELNCLISTRILEEGVDIPQCLLVVRYDLPTEYRSYIQSKGRGRSKDASYVLLVLNDPEIRSKFMSKYQTFIEIESKLRQLLVGKSLERIAPTAEDIKTSLYEEDEIPPYINPHNGNRLFSSAAISLLCRYCSVLPHDQFTTIAPMWVLETDYEKNKHIITIFMPLACPIKTPIRSDPFVNKKTARRSAALKACVLLHQIGELDEQTMLPKEYGKVDYDSLNIKDCFPNWPEEDDVKLNKNAPYPGTKARVRKHKKIYSKYLQSIPSFESKKFYLHIIKLDVAFPKPQESREAALYELLGSGHGYGLLTINPLPNLCQFSMFLTVGEVNTSLKMNYAVITLSSELFRIIKRYHFFVFDQVLEIAKQFLVYDGTTNGLYVVPIVTSDHISYEINWGAMDYKEIQPIYVPSDTERKSLKVDQKTYKHSVVTPWYRATSFPDRYIVSNVLEYMTPDSPFDLSSMGSYADYYSTKYNLDIQGPRDQPMLEVRNISSRMNCLQPRAATLTGLTDKQQRLISNAQGDDKINKFKEIFVPEFCNHYEYPGVLWYKAIMLPSIIHRVTMLLVAYELREEITEGTKYGQKHLNKGEEWLPLTANLKKAKQSLLSQVEEPAPIMNIDRINNPVDDRVARPSKLSMKDIVKELNKKKMNQDYNWDELEEPIDIDRNIEIVTVMDVECYDTFNTLVISDKKSDPQAKVQSPTKSHVSLLSAIMPPPDLQMGEIRLLSRKATGRGPELRDILTSITTINSHDTFDLERNETLGDSFLKFASTLYLFHKFSELDEGKLTNIKGRLIGNRNLYYAGEKIRLGGRMKVEHFSPRSDFVVPGFLAPKLLIDFIEDKKIRPTFLIGIQFSTQESLSGELTKESITMLQQRFNDLNNIAEPEPEGRAQNIMQGYVLSQAVSDKSVADCVESLIGTYLLSGGIEAAVKVLEWMNVIPAKDNFMSYLTKRVPSVLDKVSVEEINRVLNNTRDDVEKIINYKFKDPSLLLEALSHPSYIRNRYTGSYERLEFLGDAILDFLITSHIFENFGDMTPGDLTDLRSALVNNVTFAAYVVKLNLHKFLCYDMNPALCNAIIAFAEHQEQRQHDIIGDVQYSIDEEECQIAEYVDVPKTLSDVFESLTGAIYLDSGGDLSAVWQVVYRIMWKEINSFSTNIPKQPVRVLYEEKFACPVFGEAKLLETNISRVMMPVTFTKSGRRHSVYGVGHNKSQAKRAAAKLALKILAV
ncbi:endoribonuclease Dicer-like [Leptidea sinapis]|uniref:endoribonuclease Dicer-like n=1 Tax=Leptidea sinapis TaxID=189913 RepID=UPI0021C35304|nr:endoribonuclease Dicer-like [Leptidea sinapis]